MPADRKRPMRPRRGGRHELYASATGQHRCKQRTVAADALIADPGHLLGEALKQRIVDFRCNVTSHPSTLLDPYFAWSIDQDFGHVRLGKPAAKWLDIGLKEGIDPIRGRQLLSCTHPLAPSPEKMRSRAVKTRIGSPCRTLMVGSRLPSCSAATDAAL